MLKFLVPSFIKNLDKTLVLNYPFWYIVKMHYLLYFTAVMWIISYGIGCILPIDISSYNPENATGIWIFVFAVLGVILFCVWMYYLTIYNNEDRFGKFTIWDDTKLLVILVIGINLIMSFSYPMQFKVTSRLANTFSDEAFAKQYNDLNLGHKYITSDLDNFQYCGYDIHAIVNRDSLSIDTDAYGQRRYIYDLNKYKSFVHFSPEGRDNFDFSIYDLNSTPQKLSCSSEFKNAFLNDMQVEHEYSLHKTEAQKYNAIENYFKVTKLYQSKYKYTDRNTYLPKDYLDNYNHYKKECTTYFPDAFNLKAEDKISELNYLPFDEAAHYMFSIYNAKFKTHFLLRSGYLLFAFYFAFSISILIILFRNNTWQHFLVSAVSFILLGIIIGLISLGIGFKSEEIFPSLSILMWFVTGYLSLSYYFKKDKYRIVGVVATNLFYSVLPFMPLFLCVYCHEVFDWLKCWSDYNNPIEVAKCDIISDKYHTALQLAQLIGISAFVFGFMPFYKSYFAKQKALPRDR